MNIKIFCVNEKGKIELTNANWKNFWQRHMRKAVMLAVIASIMRKSLRLSLM